MTRAYFLKKTLFPIFLNVLLNILSANAQTNSQTPKPSGPLPRFVTLKSSVVNLHVGPGTQYPTNWKYVRQFLPVEIIAEFGIWRQVRDVDGTQGWIHQNLLSGVRYGLIIASQDNIYKDPDQSSRVLAMVEPGVLVRLLDCNNLWCRVRANSIQGWIKREKLWGLYSHENRF